MENETKIKLGRSSLRLPSLRYVVQITGTVGISNAKDSSERLAQVRSVIIDWVQTKCPKQLPQEAKEGQEFEIDIPGHKFISTTLPDSDLWVVKIEHPSDDGHVWSVEAEVATQGGNVLFGVRSYRSAIGEQFTYPARSTPTFVRDITRQFGLFDCGKSVQEEPWVLTSQSDLDTLEKFLSDHGRALPVVLITSMGGTNEENYVIDHSYLAYRSAGLAHIVLMPYELAFDWTNLVGKEWSAFRGAVRTYLPHLSFEEDDPVKHPLSTRERILDWESGAQVGSSGFVKFLINQLYYTSVSGSMWRSRFASFADVKARKLATILKASAVINDESLNVYREQIKYLTDEKEAAESLAQETELLNNEAQNELVRLNSRLYFLQSQNDRLLKTIKSTTNKSAEETIDIPKSLDDLSEWTDKYLPGRIVLHPRAVRSAKKSSYEDVGLIYKSLLLLANEYRNTRLNADDDSLGIFENRLAELNLEISKSIAPSRAGEEGDQYKIKYPPGSHDTRFLALHLKSGTSRDQRFCLRIYFFWDQETSQVVIGSLPGHLDTRTT